MTCAESRRKRGETNRNGTCCRDIGGEVSTNVETRVAKGTKTPLPWNEGTTADRGYLIGEGPAVRAGTKN